MAGKTLALLLCGLLIWPLSCGAGTLRLVNKTRSELVLARQDGGIVAAVDPLAEFTLDVAEDAVLELVPTRPGGGRIPVTQRLDKDNQLELEVYADCDMVEHVVEAVETRSTVRKFARTVKSRDARYVPAEYRQGKGWVAGEYKPARYRTVTDRRVVARKVTTIELDDFASKLICVGDDPEEQEESVGIADVELALEGRAIVVSYDLEGEGPVPIRLVGSLDGGANFDLKIESVAGDVGPGVSPGKDKRVVWEVEKDHPGCISGGEVFPGREVVLEVVVAEAE